MTPPGTSTLPSLISVVVPTHNERENAPHLYERIAATFANIPDCSFELIFADDSSDDTPSVICSLHSRDPRVKLVRLSRRSASRSLSRLP